MDGTKVNEITQHLSSLHVGWTELCEEKCKKKRQIILTDHSCAHDLLERPNMGKEERG